MSLDGKFYKLGRSLAARRDLRPSDKLVMAVLGDRIGGNGACWPGVRSLARDTGLRVATILEGLARLEQAGEIVIERQGSGRTNRYILADKSAPETVTPKDSKRYGNRNTRVTETVTEALRKPEQNQTDPLNQTHKRARSKANPRYDPRSFETFWEAYPRKVARAAAQRAWQKIRPTPELCTIILAAVEEHKQTEQWQKDGGRFIPYPATYLNGRRWEDQIEPANVAAALGCGPCDEAEGKRLLQQAGLWKGEE